MWSCVAKSDPDCKGPKEKLFALPIRRNCPDSSLSERDGLLTCCRPVLIALPFSKQNVESDWFATGPADSFFQLGIWSWRLVPFATAKSKLGQFATVAHAREPNETQAHAAISQTPRLAYRSIDDRVSANHHHSPSLHIRESDVPVRARVVRQLWTVGVRCVWIDTRRPDDPLALVDSQSPKTERSRRDGLVTPKTDGSSHWIVWHDHGRWGYIHRTSA